MYYAAYIIENEEKEVFILDFISKIGGLSYVLFAIVNYVGEYFVFEYAINQIVYDLKMQ